MCEYCKNESKMIIDENLIEVQIIAKKIYVHLFDDKTSIVDSFEINYCPMCGKRL